MICVAFYFKQSRYLYVDLELLWAVTWVGPYLLISFRLGHQSGACFKRKDTSSRIRHILLTFEDIVKSPMTIKHPLLD